MPNTNTLSLSADDMVLNGFRNFIPEITKEYFYGYCRRAYNVLDRIYNLHNKIGLDFYSLAHDYYIKLMLVNFKILEDRPREMALSAYMYKGFWFVVMNALKAHKLEFEVKSIADADVVLRYARSEDKENGMLEQVADIVTAYYEDEKMGEIARMIFIGGYKQKEVGAELGITPSAVNQRYHKMMDEVIRPFIIENYGSGIFYGSDAELKESPIMPSASFGMASVDACVSCESFMLHDEEEDRKAAEQRITSPYITSLKENEVFVFGSNLQGVHKTPAARMALECFGAEEGKGEGPQGQSYAIPTMQGDVDTIRPYVDRFIDYAKKHPDLHFLVTPVGCGVAGFDAYDIAPLFVRASRLKNVWLPEEFVDEY